MIITLYAMKRIKVKSEEEKVNLLNEVKTIKKINSKYLVNIYDCFIEHINEDEMICLILDYFDENNSLEHLIYNSSFFTSYNIWRFFIQLIIAIKSIHKNNIIIEKLSPKNIYIDKKKNIKIAGLGNFLDLNKEETDFSFYKSPEILSGEKCDKKDDMWSLGCILYEIAFKKRAFDNNKNIIEINYEMPENPEVDIKIIIGKLICKHNNRIEAEKIVFDPIFKKKIIEVNLFSEIIKYRIEGKKIFI
jgi:serine/threonine protein kinase